MQMAREAMFVIAVATAGCAQLFGIDETSAPADAPVPVTPTMSLQVERISIGSSLVPAPEVLTGTNATYFIEDASEPSGLRRVQPVLASTKDRWTADIPDDTRASVEFTLPGEINPFPRLFAFPARTIKAHNGVFEHPAMTDAPAGGAFAARLTLPSGYASGQYFRLYVAGPWVEHTFAAGELPSVDTGATQIAATIPYNTTGFPSMVGRRPTPKLTAQDQVVALRYVGNDLTAAGIVQPFEQTGGTDMVTATLATVPHAPLDVTITPMASATRLAGTSPPLPTVSMAWYVTASPAWKLASNIGPILNAIGIAPTDAPKVTAMYGNPFDSLGWTSLFSWIANRYRTYMVPSFNLPLNLYAGLYEFDLVAPGLNLDHPAGLPVLVSINKTPLNADGLSITLDPTKAVELSLVADRATNLHYQWNVYEVIGNTPMQPTSLEYKVAYVALSTETSVKIPGDAFAAGKVYMIRAHCIQGGYPSFTTGDLTVRDVPYALGFLDAGVFTVKAP
jgi:hypothetical protein